jgi:hypothetical protein
MLTFAFCAVLVAAPALAQDRGGWERRHVYAQQDDRHPPPKEPPRQAAREYDRRDHDGARRSLTADERRELDRDLRRANREIYRKGRDNR